MDKYKKYYWRHKETRRFLYVIFDPQIGTSIYGVSKKDARPAAMINRAKLSPAEMVDLGFNFHHFDNLEIGEE